MEIEVEPVSMEARLGYLQKIAENQQVNAKKFPWGVVIISFVLGAGVAAVIYYQKYRKKSENREVGRLTS